MDEITSDEVLALFREEIPGYLDGNWKEVPLELDSDLFDHPRDDLEDALQKYQQRYSISLDNLNWALYFPWENTPLFQRWFKLRREDVESTRLPLTVRMFAESAAAGRWLYD
ncbi:MAG: DUF1493 family protein [Citrobacter sp.]|uniref:DUF1493 family protein n=1 Tax=Citrobacter sp. TaxID=1896336 RepID=UPI002FC65AAB